MVTIFTPRSSERCFDYKCSPGDGCWYCSHKCDHCMKNSVSGYGTQTAIETALRFCGEECRSFIGHPHPFTPDSSVQVPLEKVTILILSDSCGDGTSDIECTHLLNFTISFKDERNSIPPTQATLDIYRVEKGSELRSGLFFLLFELKKLYSQRFGEFFLTDSFHLDRPLPHAKLHLDDETNKLLNDLLQEGVLRSGYDLDIIRSLGLNQTPTPPQSPDSAERNSIKELENDSSDDISGLFD